MRYLLRFQKKHPIKFCEPLPLNLIWCSLIAMLMVSNAAAEPKTVQTKDIGTSGDFEVSATFEVVARGDTLAGVTAEDSDLYIGDEAVLRVVYSGASLVGNQANLRCLLRDLPPGGTVNEKDCTPNNIPIGSIGAQGEYSIGFKALITDPPGLWITTVRFEDVWTGDAVTVELRFFVHTEFES